MVKISCVIRGTVNAGAAVLGEPGGRGGRRGGGHGRRNEILIQDRGSERRRRKKFRYVPATLMPIGSFLSGRYTTAVFGLAPCLCNVASGVPSCT